MRRRRDRCPKRSAAPKGRERQRAGNKRAGGDPRSAGGAGGDPRRQEREPLNISKGGGAESVSHRWRSAGEVPETPARRQRNSPWSAVADKKCGRCEARHDTALKRAGALKRSGSGPSERGSGGGFDGAKRRERNAEGGQVGAYPKGERVPSGRPASGASGSTARLPKATAPRKRESDQACTMTAGATDIHEGERREGVAGRASAASRTASDSERARSVSDTPRTPVFSRACVCVRVRVSVRAGVNNVVVIWKLYRCGMENPPQYYCTAVHCLENLPCEVIYHASNLIQVLGWSCHIASSYRIT